MERVVHISKSFEEAEEWEFQQNISMTPQERLDIMQRLREEYYIFKNENRTIYKDTCCHYNQYGNDLVVRKIGKIIGENERK